MPPALTLTLMAQWVTGIGMLVGVAQARSKYWADKIDCATEIARWEAAAIEKDNRIGNWTRIT